MNGCSVPDSRRTLYCSAVNFFFNSSSFMLIYKRGLSTKYDNFVGLFFANIFGGILRLCKKLGLRLFG